ncbi:hemagglutinin repeat-containing protein [Fusobacterium polymorphum]|nr:hemolysin [Fusobacterium polymorphum]
MKSGDILGGIASSTNTVTGVVSGLASNQGTKLPLSAVNKNNSDDDNDDDQNNQDNTVGKDNLKAAQATNNFYANAGVNLGFNKSSSNSNSHSESAVVTTIRGKDKNSSITYNNVKNIEYIGTQAQNTKFIYNNVDNITKRVVELNNYSSSSSKSSGISTGVTIGYGDGVQTSVDTVKLSASQSKMNTNGTTYQNGRFVDVDEVHNNTKNMTLSGFNQEGGKVTGNIQNLTIESKQNTSTTKGSTTGGSLSIAPNGIPSGSASYSQTNGERRVVDSPTTFIIGDGSNLKVGKVENTAGAIGATGSGKLSIDEYIGHNLENVDKLKTVGGSVGISTSGINSIGINYSDRKQEGITKNTVIGNVEIGKSSGDEINKDLGSMTEITKDRDFKTDINIESQTINYIKNPEAFKQDLKKAKNEIEDIGNVIENTVNPPGEDKRNFFKNLRAQRWNTSFYNVTGSRMEELSRQFKAGEIDEKQLKEAVRELAKGYGKDIGIEYEVVYLDEATMPEDAKGSTGSTYILDEKNRKVLIPIDVSTIGDINELFGTLTEEISHGKDALEGRQDKKVAEDETNKEKGLESLGRPANDYVKNKLGEDNNSKIKLSTDGIDLTNADVGEKVGDVITLEDRKFKKYYHKETNKLEIAVNSFKEIPKGISYIGNLALDSAVDALFAEDMEQSIKNLNNKDNISKYIKIFRKKGRKDMLNEMSKEFDKIYLSDVSKKLFVIYGAPDEIRKLYTNKEKDKNNNDIDMFILDKHLPEHMEDLWSNPKTSDNLDKISNYWKNELGDEDSFSLSEQNRERNKTIAYPDFTSSYKFYAFGKTKLFQSTYGSVKRLENGKYDVNITVIFQYTDRFEDVKNVNELPSAKQGLNKEFKGGKTFSFRTEPKRVTIKMEIDDLGEIRGLLENRLKGIDDNSNLGQYNIKGNVSLIKNNKLDNSNEIDNLKKYYNQ